MVRQEQERRAAQGRRVQEFALLVDSKTFAYAVQGAAMAGAIAYSMKAPPYVIYSCLAVGYATNSLGGAGGPLAVFFVTIIAVFLGKLVSKRTPVDLLVTPTVTIVGGVLIATLIAPPIGAAASWLLLPPGAAHMSSTRIPGCTPSSGAAEDADGSCE